MRPQSEYQEARRLIEAGVNDSEIGRRLGIPRPTIREWRTKPRSKERDARCFRCANRWFDEDAYAYILGIYLGDGCLSAHPRGVYRLRIACDLKYPEIINEIAAHIVILRGAEPVGFRTMPGCVEVNAYWKHWPCLFPQHAPGRKHERQIELVEWQQQVVDAYPKSLIRGLIHSDGNRHINQVTRELATGPKPYRYPRYMFTNASEDILQICTDALDLLDIHWTKTTTRVISVARRDDVAFVDTFVGPKS